MVHIKKGSSGHLLKNSAGHIINECGSTFPDSCPYPDTSQGPSRLRIQAYTDGDIPASNCGDCLSNSGTNWDGTIPYRVSSCGWALSWSPNTIDGKYLNSDDGGVSFYPTGWEFWVQCYGSSDYVDIYRAVKATGDTPMGTYTVDTGRSCIATPTTIVIESY